MKNVENTSEGPSILLLWCFEPSQSVPSCSTRPPEFQTHMGADGHGFNCASTQHALAVNVV